MKEVINEYIQSYKEKFNIADFIALYVLRAEVRLHEGDLLGAAVDVATVMQSDQSETWGPIVSASQTGDINCENLLESDLTSILDGTPW